VIAVTTLLFSGWAVYGLVRVIVGGIGALFGRSSGAYSGSVMRGQGAGQVRCPQPRCHANNPPGASFCRRCGASLSGYPVDRQVSAARHRPRPMAASAPATSAPARAADRVA
jgi:hypothetical protein